MSLGHALATARRDAGMSLDDVAAATRIRRTLVAAIENDDFRLCGDDFYSKAHIRGIARVVGADPEPLLASFCSGHPPAGADDRAVKPRPGEAMARKRPNWSAAMAAVLVLVLGFGLYRVFTGGGPTDTRSVIAARTTSTTPTGRPARDRPSVPVARRPTPRPIAQARRTGVNVRLTATSGPSWVDVTNGAGKRLFQGLVARGVVRSFSDPAKVRLVLGNAGSVALIVNGKRVGVPGRAGSVARVEFGPADPAAG